MIFNHNQAQNTMGLLFWSLCALLLQLLIQKDEKYGIQNTNMKKRFYAYWGTFKY